jgi:CheY-like chemotaxis protein
MMTTRSEGFDVARSLSKDEMLKGIPIVMVTGVRREMNLPFGFEPDSDWLPVKAVLEKPIKPDNLLKVVADNILK